MVTDRETDLGRSPPEGGWERVSLLWRIASEPIVLFLLCVIAVELLVLPTPLTLKWAAVTLGLLMFAVVASGGRPDSGSQLLNYLIEAGVSAVLASSLVAAVNGQHGAIHLQAEHLVATVALAIVLSGVSIVAKSAHTIRAAEDKFTLEATRLQDTNKQISGHIPEIKRSTEGAERGAERAASTADRLESLLKSFNQEIEKAQLVGIAARALGLENETIKYPPLKSPIDAAMGTMRTWAQTTRTHFPQGDDGVECGPAEASWWRCLECYHKEERYDLARFEMVTNSRNYTYVLVSVLDQMRISTGLKPSEASSAPAAKKATDQSVREVVVVQCSTFGPKDFYNFPKGPKDYREYRDVEFYGTYRRGVSFLNRQTGMFPHRIVFVAEEDNSDDKITDKTTSDLEKLGWSVDTRTATVLGSSRLYCAPYSLPLPQTAVVDAPAVFFDKEWAESMPGGNDCIDLGSRAGRGKEQICPVVPNLANAGQRTRTWERKARRQMVRALAKRGAGRDEVNKLLEKCPQDVWLPEVLSYLKDREAWAWLEIIKKSRDDMENAPESDFSPVKSSYEALEETRQNLLNRAATPGVGDYEESICSLVQDLIARSQTYDAAIEELRAKRVKDVGTSAEWMNLRSMIGLQMGPGEAWLYHALNRVNALLFNQLSPKGDLVPAWNLFGWDFLGLKSAEVNSGGSLNWESAESDTRSLKSRVRFVPVRPGARSDLASVGEDGVLSALGFQSRCFQREFTLIGSRPLGAAREEKANPFEEVKWELLVTCEMAPPYSTCRLNFHVGDEGGSATVLDDYGKWVTDTWLKTENFSKGVVQDIAKEIIATQGSRAPAP